MGGIGCCHIGSRHALVVKIEVLRLQQPVFCVLMQEECVFCFIGKLGRLIMMQRFLQLWREWQELVNLCFAFVGVLV